MIVIEDEKILEMPSGLFETPNLDLSSPKSNKKYVYVNQDRQYFLTGLTEQWRRGQFIDCYVRSAQSIDDHGANNAASDLNDRFPAHRIVLASQSRLLDDLMSVQVTQQNVQEGIVDVVVNEDPIILHALLAFMYTGEVALSNRNVMQMFSAAQRYGCPELQRLCEQHVAKSIELETVLPMLANAQEHNAPDLEKRCLEYFEVHAEEIFENQIEQFIELSKSSVVEILRLNFTMDEHTVWEYVKEWGRRHGADDDDNNWGEVLSEISECIRFVSLSKGCLKNEILPLGIISAEMLVEVLFEKARDPPQLGDGNQRHHVQQQQQQQQHQSQEERLWMTPRQTAWLTLANFASEAEYGEYLISVLRPGMLLMAVRTYENIMEGDIGEYLQHNRGFPPCQVNWTGYGGTYWLHWRDIVIVEP